MPMDLLHQLSQTPLPAQVVEPHAIYKLHVLRVAGHVFASIPSPQYAIDGRWHQGPATVHQVTALGRKVLRYFGPVELGASCEKDHAF
jgi:hypothetical protein